MKKTEIQKCKKETINNAFFYKIIFISVFLVGFNRHR